MQTFITDSSFAMFGICYLDQKRLVKQLLESRQIMAALAGETKGWVNHPATKMWRGKETLLEEYAIDLTIEMGMRDYKWQNNLDALQKSYSNILRDRPGTTLGDFSDDEYNKIIYTHRGRLYEKDPVHYAGWSYYSDYKKMVCCDRCNYYWPTHLVAV